MPFKSLFSRSVAAALCTLFIATQAIAQPGIISTIAGTGAPAYGGDGGLATSAIIHNPVGIATDLAGNIYIADRNNYRIRKISTSGVITTIVGTGSAGFSGDGGAATAATINYPGDIVLDNLGNLYFADSYNNCVRMVNTSGIITTIAGTGIAGYSGDGGAATSAKLNIPIGIALDASTGTIYIADQQNHRVRKVNAAGIISTIVGNGTVGYSGDGGPSTSALINYPNYVSVDQTGNVYVTDNGNHCIRKISTTGIITTVAGNGLAGATGDGGPATAARLNYPAGTSFDSAGKLYIADYGNNRIRIVNASGTITTIAGTGGAGFAGDGGTATAALLGLPIDVAFNLAGDVLIADYGNNRLRLIGAINNAPSFTGGASQTLHVCEDGPITSINSLLSVLETNAGQTLTWSTLIDPLHGTLLVSYSTTATGGTVVPTGLTFTPAAGYAGTDIFKVMVNDGALSDTITINVIIDTPPSPGVIAGTATVCPTATTTLSITGGDAGGTWTSANTTVADIGSSDGVVTGMSAGTSTISYTVSNSCGTAVGTSIVTVNPSPNSGTITGTATVCPTATATLSNPTGDAGGAWSSFTTAVATIGTSSGIVTGVAAGTSTISYTVTNSCGTAAATRVVTVNPSPNAGAITGTATVCPTAMTTLSDPTGDAGGAWTSSTTAIATIGATTGIVTGVAAGTSTISYTVTNSCGTARATRVVTVNPLSSVAPITGASTVCPAGTITLSDLISGGVWSTSTPANATVNASGVVFGVAAGTTTISYAVTNSCGTATATKIVTVNPGPNAGTIIGTATVCPGLTTTLSDAVSGGTWNSSVPSVATINASGVVNGLVAGTTTISYTATNSCGTATVTVIATVNPLPAAIGGSGIVCQGASTLMTDSDPGGTWSTISGGVSIGASSGSVTGLSAGTGVITYMLPTTCLTTAIVTVNPLPNIFGVTGGGGYCVGGAGVTIGLASSNAGITYQLYSGATPIGTAMAGTGTALDYGLITTAGTYTVQATNVTTSCVRSMTGSATIIVNAYVAPSVSITHSYPGTSACNGSSATFTAVPTNGGPTPSYQWHVNGIMVGTSVNNYSYVPVDGDDVSVTLITGGVCAFPATAATSYTVSVLPVGAPAISISSSPANPICAGTTVLFSSTTTMAGTAPTYLWLKNGVNVATGSTYGYIPSGGDVIQCKMVSNYACRTSDLASSNTITMAVQPNIPAAVVTINAMPGTVISAGQMVTFSAVAAVGSSGKKYQWFINGTIISGATNSTFVSSTLANGNVVTCRVANDDACRNSTDKSVTISVGGLGVAGNVQAAKMTVYPNPNDGTFVVNIPSLKKESANVIILNALGEKVCEFTAATNEDVPLHLKAAAGMYFISAVTEEAVFSTRFELH